MVKITTAEIEIAVANKLGTRKNIIVPNISWGANIHECDIFSVNESGYCTEVEIKVSISDLKADFKKSHQHKSNKIKYFYYALPDYLLEKSLPMIPEHAGIITIRKIVYQPRYSKFYCTEITAKYHRFAKKNTDAIALSQKEIVNIGRLGVLRYWSIRRADNGKKQKIKITDKIQLGLFD